jgi:hypothetical protein
MQFETARPNKQKQITCTFCRALWLTNLSDTHLASLSTMFGRYRVVLAWPSVAMGVRGLSGQPWTGVVLWSKLAPAIHEVETFFFQKVQLPPQPGLNHLL